MHFQQTTAAVEQQRVDNFLMNEWGFFRYTPTEQDRVNDALVDEWKRKRNAEALEAYKRQGLMKNRRYE